MNRTVKDIPFVHQGQEGWLFLLGGSNFVASLYEREGGHLPDKKLTLWRDAIIERKRRCDALGITYAHLIAPEKLTIYGHKLCEPVVDIALAPTLRLSSLFDRDQSRSGLVDLVEPMLRLRDDIKLYYFTDTHWTPEGTLIAYSLLCQALGIPCNAELVSRPFRDSNRLMDLGIKMTPQVYEVKREFWWTQDAKRIEINRVLEFLETPFYGGLIHVGARAIFSNPYAVCDKKILLFGDSFSAADPHMLTALLAETVREVEFVWSANVDWKLVESVRPDILITEIAERNMALEPDDRFSLRRTERSQVLKAYRKRFDAWLKDRVAQWRDKRLNGRE